MPTLSPGARLSKSTDGGILLDLDRGVFFHLNPVGTRIVELLERRCGLESIVHTIGCEFQTPEEIVKLDLDDFLVNLQAQRLLAGDRSASGDAW
jgi:Coenzyme PQQ synthesis protein D (PqqD)